MLAEINIKRGEAGKSGRRYDCFHIECSENATIAFLLDKINQEAADPVDWECSCRQKMCGACAMVINGRPRLACNTFVRDTGAKIRLEPLSKFPLIRDLRVDRSIIRDIVVKLQAYPAAGADADYEDCERQYLASTCLMCGCCMEVCPSFTGKDNFGSALAVNSMYRTISQEKDPKRKKELKKAYLKTQYRDCAGALSCAAVCPQTLPQASLMSLLNRSLWKREKDA
ncbi:MAG: 2Fe-2S iron-sulfur cluster-binding protein [Oscillospiraceae bacterium]|jgi:succinate dehydrogenase / fumarate reductase iron-sulfur subunit|nr:2Fe-2S iron-sulfur cluster-binding protein [Oscillospiraceae bacterium]